jgi:hypothetical protein
LGFFYSQNKTLNRIIWMGFIKRMDITDVYVKPISSKGLLLTALAVTNQLNNK